MLLLARTTWLWEGDSVVDEVVLGLFILFPIDLNKIKLSMIGTGIDKIWFIILKKVILLARSFFTHPQKL